MKKLFLTALAAISLAFMACAPSKIEIQEASSMSDVLIEVRQVLNDSISLYVGNVFYLNSRQIVADEMFPLEASTRDPSEFEKLTPTDVINSDEEFLSYLRRKAPDMMNVGIVIGETAYNEVGFEEAIAVEKLTKIFQKIQGGSLTLFHEKEGQLTDMKKLY
ncbi:hypothetical protein [Fibrobacter sp.]|jgi:hypothetical protein|uniref:hypothetical protein n=1 Tax=Fibrobacter sp. TaxID=35828 RepID=UPI00386F5A65